MFSYSCGASSIMGWYLLSWSKFCLVSGIVVKKKVLKDGLFHTGVSWVPVTCEIPQGRKAGAWWMPWNQSERLGWGRSLTTQCSWKLSAWACSLGIPGEGTAEHSLYPDRIVLTLGVTDKCGNWEILALLLHAGLVHVVLQHLWKTFSRLRNHISAVDLLVQKPALVE